MKTKLLTLLVVGAFSLVAVPAHALLLLPGEADATTNVNSNLNTTAQIESAFGFASGSLTGFTLSYKSEVSGGAGIGSDSGPFAGSYTTTFSNTATDPQDALIRFIFGQDSILCPTCFLLVKDGNATPAQYYFDLGTWNGTDNIELTGFWPQQGAISNVAIWNFRTVSEECPPGWTGVFPNCSPPQEVPEPGSLALLGLGLAGLAAIRRRKQLD